jgi:hypothetical protein
MIGIIKLSEIIFIIEGFIFIGFPTKPISKNFSILELGSLNLSVSLSANMILASFPDSPTARPPAAWILLTISLLIEPDKT